MAAAQVWFKPTWHIFQGLFAVMLAGWITIRFIVQWYMSNFPSTAGSFSWRKLTETPIMHSLVQTVVWCKLSGTGTYCTCWQEDREKADEKNKKDFSNGVPNIWYPIPSPKLFLWWEVGGDSKSQQIFLSKLGFSESPCNKAVNDLLLLELDSLLTVLKMCWSSPELSSQYFSSPSLFSTQNTNLVKTKQQGG